MRARRAVHALGIALAAMLALGVWAALAVLATRSPLQALWDVTPQAQFSVTTATEDLLADVRRRGAVLEIDTFYAQLPDERTVEERYLFGMMRRIQELTTDLLRIYDELGGESVQVTHFDVLRDVARSRERLKALGGVTQQNVVVVRVGKRSRVLSLHYDLADIDFPAARPNSGQPAQRTYPTLQVYKGEEAITSAARSLLAEGIPRAYFLTGYGEASIKSGVADSYSELVGALIGDGFAVAELNLEQTGAVPADATVVALLEPRKEMSPRAVAALFDWIRRGGRFVLNVSFFNQIAEWNPTLDALGELCGFEVGKELVCHLVGDPADPREPGRGGPGADALYVQVHPNHPATAPLVRAQRVPILKLAREVRARGERPPEGVTLDTAFLRTGPWAWLARSDRTGEASLDAPAVQQAYGPRSVGAVATVAPQSGDRPGQVVVISGIAFLNGQGFSINGDLALNVFNWMARREELVTVRGNRYRARSLALVPQQLERVRSLLVYWVPGTLLLLAVGVFAMRRFR